MDSSGSTTGQADRDALPGAVTDLDVLGFLSGNFPELSELRHPNIDFYLDHVPEGRCQS